ncbi:MAG TPA: hypothetical protein PLJ44_08430 [Victivallales bacterium]|nr:hypothetical protein [Victivallales bacterium]
MFNCLDPYKENKNQYYDDSIFVGIPVKGSWILCDTPAIAIGMPANAIFVTPINDIQYWFLC